MLESCVSMEPDIYEFEEHALFDVTEPVHILGKTYTARTDYDRIKAAITSLLWMTYRRNFSAIGGTGPTSDQGWGCMLRCGQMMLAHTLSRIHLNNDWSWKPNECPTENAAYCTLLKKFADRKDALYSLHQIGYYPSSLAQMGVSEGKAVGEWFGPNTVAQVLKKLCVFEKDSCLAVHVAMDNVLILHDIQQLCAQRRALHQPQPAPSYTGAGGPDWWCPLLLIVPLRLGLTALNQCYLDAIQAFYSLPQCVGIMGGRPNHALYFYGCVGADKLLYLDPHTCQDSVDLDSLNEQSDATYHHSFVLSIDALSVDPSLALGFYCHTHLQFTDLVHRLRTDVFPKSTPPIFELLDERPRWFPPFEPYTAEQTPSRIQDYTVFEPRYDTDEEFEVLD